MGRKTDWGYYLFRDGVAGDPDPEVEALILEVSARKVIRQVPLSHESIMGRILSTMQAERHRILEEGIARSADDVVMVKAYGFPRWMGCPMFLEGHPASRTD